MRKSPTKREARAEAEWRAAFQPHAIIVTERSVPALSSSPPSSGLRSLRIDFDTSLPEETYVHQALAKLPEQTIAFGRPIGVTINYAPDRAVRYDLKGDPIETLTEAVRCGKSVSHCTARQKRHVCADRESSWIAVDIITTKLNIGVLAPNSWPSKTFVRQNATGTWRTTMRNDRDDRNFPAIRLADASNFNSPTELHRYRLKELAELLDQFHSFTKGQFVKWKPGLKNRKFPDYGEPAIVTAILPSPIFDPGETTAGKPVLSGTSDVRPRNIQG